MKSALIFCPLEEKQFAVIKIGIPKLNCFFSSGVCSSSRELSKSLFECRSKVIFHGKKSKNKKCLRILSATLSYVEGSDLVVDDVGEVNNASFCFSISLADCSASN